MANFYWRGQAISSVTGISAFDFNEPSNWLIFENRNIEDGCVPYLSSIGGGPVIAVSPSRGVGIYNYGVTDESSGYGWGGDSNVCRVYGTATRAPGPGDVVVIGDDIPMGQTPLLFGGFQGGSTGGVWLNGADDGNGGYTHASGTTYNSSLAAFYYGGMGFGHPDFNYVWGRIGGGMTANSSKYGQYPDTYGNNWADQLWKWYFTAGSTAMKRNPDGTYEEITVPTAIFSGATWTAEQLTERTQSLRIKADYMEEAVRSYTGIPNFCDIVSVKNLRRVTDPLSGNAYDKVCTNYVRYSRNTTSFINVYFDWVQNKPADTRYKDFPGGNGETFDDQIHDMYYMLPTERLILNGVTASSVRSYISDSITVASNCTVASVHIDDTFSIEEDSIYCFSRDRVHNIQGIINADKSKTDLGTTGTAEGADYDSKLLIRAKTGSFVISPKEGTSNPTIPGSFTVVIGNSTGLTGITCDIDIVDVDINSTIPATSPFADHRPAKIKFSGTAPSVVNTMTIKCASLMAEGLPKETPIAIGTLKLGNKAWFYPHMNQHPKWYFGTRVGAYSGNFFGGIQFLQEANVSDSDLTSEFVISPYFVIHNAAVGLTAPSQITPFLRTGGGVAEITSGKLGGA